MDELLKEAIEITIEHGQGSVSLLQRKLFIGYNRAGRLMDTMCKLGVVEEARPVQPREVLINDISEVNFETLKN